MPSAIGTPWGRALCAAVCTAAVLMWGAPRHGAADGPLRAHPNNPRFFTHDGNRALYLAGHQWFNDLQHSAWDHANEVDWERYLDFLRERRMNYLRNWIIWSTGQPNDDVPSPRMPFARTGPGTALDGQPKFDLTRFDEEFFKQLASQIAAAEKRGVYISVMLFEVYGFLGRSDFWQGNLFHGPNNVQGIDVDLNGDGHGMEFFYTDNPQVQDIQRRYVQKMVETLNPYDNVFFEIANELHAPDWQLDVLRTIKETEAALPKQHLVYLSPGGRILSGGWSTLPKEFLFDSPADVIAVPGGWDRRYSSDPPVEEAGRPVFMDMDHVAVSKDGDNSWNNNPLTPWKLLTRGYHVCIYDYDYWKPMPDRREAWDATRRSCGAAAHLANRLDLAAMHPRPDLANTSFCLAKPGAEYVVLQPGAEEVVVRDLERGSIYEVEWLSPTSADVVSRQVWTATATAGTFPPPSPRLVLHLTRRPQTAGARDAD